MTNALPPRIGINAVFLEPNMGGLDTYARALVPELVRLAPEVRFTVFCNPRGRTYLEREGWGAQVELHTHPLLGRRGLKAVGELTLLGELAGRRVDLLHSLGMTAPLRTRAVSVVTLADVTWIVAPDPGEATTYRLWRAVVPPVARRAARVIALSEAGAADVAKHLGVPRERIDVVPLAAGPPPTAPPATASQPAGAPPTAQSAPASPAVSPATASQPAGAPPTAQSPPASQPAGPPLAAHSATASPPAAAPAARPAPTPAPELRARLALGPGPVILTVSAKKAHKNLARLLRALPAVLERHPDARLVLPGNPTPHERELQTLAAELGLGAHTVFPPYVDAADLEGLYALAACFVFPSLNEGFGLPVLEAMRRGVPVACARASALPEVAGDAALYFDPLDVGDLARALQELLADHALAERLVVRGRARATTFTWEATARGTLDTYARAWADRSGGHSPPTEAGRPA